MADHMYLYLLTYLLTYSADDDLLYKQILSNPNHVLAPLLPDKTESHYSLRSW